jgi:hypothetical protein
VPTNKDIYLKCLLYSFCAGLTLAILAIVVGGLLAGPDAGDAGLAIIALAFITGVIGNLAGSGWWGYKFIKAHYPLLKKKYILACLIFSFIYFSLAAVLVATPLSLLHFLIVPYITLIIIKEVTKRNAAAPNSTK